MVCAINILNIKEIFNASIENRASRSEKREEARHGRRHSGDDHGRGDCVQGKSKYYEVLADDGFPIMY